MPNLVFCEHVQPALVGRFAIRNDALFSVNNFLTLLTSASKLAVGIAGIGTLAGAATLVASVHAFYKFYCDIVSQGFVLSDEQLAVVGVLRDMEKAATSDEIAKHMRSNIGTDAIEKALAGFKRTSDAARGFIVQDEKARWSIVDL